jgi:Dit-like phage tail protein
MAIGLSTLSTGIGIVGGLLGGVTRVQFIQNNSTVIQLDASLKEVHTRNSHATKFPVENGQVISDHIIIEPFDLEINGIITDTPIGGAAGLLQEAGVSIASKLLPPAGLALVSQGVGLLQSLSNSKSPSVAAYVQLLNLQSKAQPFDVLTSLYRYPSMWIDSISAPRDVETGKSLIFTVKLVQLILVTPQSVNVQIFANPGLAASLANQGQQSTGIPNGFAAGYASSTAAIGAVLPKGIG